MYIGMTRYVKDRTSDWTLQGMRRASMMVVVTRVCESCAVQIRMTIVCELDGRTVCACVFGCVAYKNYDVCERPD